MKSSSSKWGYWPLSASTTVIVAFALAGSVAANDWPQFRGPNADGISPSKLPTEWSADGDQQTNIRWKIPVGGEGWSAPVLLKDRVYLTSAVPQKDLDATGSLEYSGGGGSRRDDLTSTIYRYEVVCLSADDGSEVWRTAVKVGAPPIPRHSSNTYATETMIAGDDSLYAYFGMNGVYCLDLEGNVKWERDLGAYEMRAGWGTSSSPAFFDGKLFVQVDNEEQSFLVALDAKSGADVWRVNRNEQSQYSSPMIWQNSKRAELIAGGLVYRSYDPNTGDLLWELDMGKGRSSATAVADGDRLFIGTELRNRGGDDDGGGHLFAVKAGGSGDITPELDATSGPFIDWKIDRSDLQMASPTVCRGFLYLLQRRTGNMQCVNAETGETAYRKRLPGARAFWASPLSDQEHVYCLDTGGTMYVLAGGPNYELISENEIDEQTWSTPAASDGDLYLRTVEHLYRIGNSNP